MASIRKRGDAWQVEIRIKGVYECRTFPSRQMAKEWGIKREAEIHEGQSGAIPDRPFADALVRYRDTVSNGKRGGAWEAKRITAVLRDPLASVSLRTLQSVHVAAWRDRRLQTVTGETVNREWNLLSHVCTICVKEWKWLKENPFSQVRRPPAGKARERLVTEAEIEALRVASGWIGGTESPADTVAAKTFACFIFALETGMRASEICGLVSVAGAVAHLPITKNGTSRQVPLSPKALEIWSQYPNGFGLTPTQLDANFRRLKRLAGIEGLHFHDARHSAATRLAQKFPVLDLCRIMGWRNVNEAMTYYNPTAESLAERMKDV